MSTTRDYVTLNDLVKVANTSIPESVDTVSQLLMYGDNVLDINVVELIGTTDKNELEDNLFNLLKGLTFNLNDILKDIVNEQMINCYGYYFTNDYNVATVIEDSANFYTITKASTHTCISTKTISEVKLGDDNTFVSIINVFNSIIIDAAECKKNTSSYTYPKVYEGLDPQQVMKLIICVLDGRYPNIDYTHVKSLEHESITINRNTVHNDYINQQHMVAKSDFKDKEMQSINGRVVLTFMINSLI